MADVDNPKTHVENDSDAKLPRVQPESPRRTGNERFVEGIDPLTEGDTMYPSSDTKSDSEKLAKKESKAEATEVDETYLPDEDTTSTEGNDEPARDEPSAATRQRTQPVKAEGKVQPQTARPANTNDSAVAEGETEPAASDTNAATGEAPSKNAKEAAKNGSGTSAPVASADDGEAKPTTSATGSK